MIIRKGVYMAKVRLIQLLPKLKHSSMQQTLLTHTDVFSPAAGQTPEFANSSVSITAEVRNKNDNH